MLWPKGIQDYYLFSGFTFVHVFLYFRNGTDVYLQWENRKHIGNSIDMIAYAKIERNLCVLRKYLAYPRIAEKTKKHIGIPL
jgi:hypothetical protein